MKKIALLLPFAAALLITGCTASTQPATHITQTSAKLHSQVTWSQGEQGTYWFNYRGVGAVLWQKTPTRNWGPMPSNGGYDVTENLTGLSPATSYEFQFCGTMGPSGEKCFETKAFTTQGGFPDASNTGVPPGTTLTQSGGITVNTANTVVNAVDAPWVDVNAANVTIRNSDLGEPGAIFPIQVVSGSVTVEDTTINCGGGFTGVAFGNYTLRRVEITGCENGAHVDNNSSILDSWIHDLDASGDNHTDGIQFSGGAGNILIRHNNIEKIAPEGTNGGTSAIIMHTGTGAQNHDVTIENNRLDGDDSVVALYCPRAAASNIFVNNNRMVVGWLAYTNECTGNHVTQFNGNVDDMTGAAISQGQ